MVGHAGGNPFLPRVLRGLGLSPVPERKCPGWGADKDRDRGMCGGAVGGRGDGRPPGPAHDPLHLLLEGQPGAVEREGVVGLPERSHRPPASAWSRAARRPVSVASWPESNPSPRWRQAAHGPGFRATRKVDLELRIGKDHRPDVTAIGHDPLPRLGHPACRRLTQSRSGPTAETEETAAVTSRRNESGLSAGWPSSQTGPRRSMTRSESPPFRFSENCLGCPLPAASTPAAPARSSATTVSAAIERPGIEMHPAQARATAASGARLAAGGGAVDGDDTGSRSAARGAGLASGGPEHRMEPGVAHRGAGDVVDP